MNDNGLAQKEHIFNTAAEIADRSQRAAYLKDACEGDSELRREIEDLLLHDEEDSGFLKSLSSDLQITQVGPITEKPGDTIGPYKLLQEIGKGGMGVVYLAERSQPVSQRVALKIVKPGMDTSDVLARFEAERQALALMDHPNIARALDAGTTDAGRPYFVMELVKGVPITQFCDERKLSTRERLELFLPVCQAVQHAHQKGIIHRDIKPSNILVAQYDNTFVPKIIDFGLAKAMGQRLTDKTMFTRHGQILGTLEYMSPEQASFNQLDVDTRSDIYSLGVVLYELLSGETPFDRERFRSAAFDEMLRIIREEEPPRPSFRLSSLSSKPSIAEHRGLEPKKLTTLLRGELDWIVMKAIDKERDRRYQTATGFAEDIDRYLTGEAVWACPPSASYRLRKFARKYRGLFASAMAVFAALLLGLAGTGYALVETKEAEDKALRRLKRAESESKESAKADELQRARAERLVRFQDMTTEAMEQLAVEIAPVQASEKDELIEWKQDLADSLIQYWDQVIEAETDEEGNPGARQNYFRILRAVALARFGRIDEAIEATEALPFENERLGGWLDEVSRVYAICAQATDDSIESEKYVNHAIDALKQAAQREDIKPPLSEDPDFIALRSHDDYQPLLNNWQNNWDNRQNEAPERSKMKSTRVDND